MEKYLVEVNQDLEGSKRRIESYIQALEAEVQSLVNVLYESIYQAMDSIIWIRDVEGLLNLHPSKWVKAYEEVVDLKRQMNLLEEVYDEMRKWCTYVEGHNQEMVDTIEEYKDIMLKL